MISSLKKYLKGEHLLLEQKAGTLKLPGVPKVPHGFLPYGDHCLAHVLALLFLWSLSRGRILCEQLQQERVREGEGR